MKNPHPLPTLLLPLLLTSLTPAATPTSPSDSPADHLPPYITRLTSFGERADFSHDGHRILFLSKTFGDAMELDLPTHSIRNLTAFYPHLGYTRALYLSNGDILLSGPDSFDPAHPHTARTQCSLSILDKSLTKPPVPLHTKCSEGPAVSRTRLHIAWTHVAAQYPTEMPPGTSRIVEADITYDANHHPTLTNQHTILDSRDLPFKCTLETQNFVPPDETTLTFSAYGHQGTDVCTIDLTTKKVIDQSNSPHQYDEPEGIFPDGKSTLVECDKQNQQGPAHVDLWRLTLDGTGTYTQRLTRFSDYPTYKASNPVVSDDGHYIAFQLARSTESAGVGHGLFLLDLQKLPTP